MNLYSLILLVRGFALGWPLMLYVVIAGIICTVALKGIQFRSFFSAFKIIFSPSHDGSESPQKKHGDMTPFQAFVNTLSSNLGNGSIAGVATAVCSGGPGSAFWIVFFGLLLMSVRFVEVYISALVSTQGKSSLGLGGPMIYVRLVPGGMILTPLYAFFCLLFGLAIGNAMQSNSIALSLNTTWGIPQLPVALILFFFVLYVVCGGAERIVKISDQIVPLKVALFVIAACTVLGYHFFSIPTALALIIRSAFTPVSFAGGLLGFSVQQAVLFGMGRSIMATESGLGTAAILFGSSQTSQPLTSGLMGMISTFISTCVCFIVALCIVASGVWDSGLTSTALTIASFNTVFGSFGGWIVSFLSISFGIGVTISYAYIVRSSWLFLTQGRYQYIFIILYTTCAFAGALVDVNIVWATADIINAAMLLINLFSILWLLPQIVTHINNATTI